MGVPVVCLTSALLGIASHQQLFKHGEWDRHTPTVAATYASAMVLSPLLPFVLGSIPPYEALLLVLIFWISYFLGLFGSIILYRVFLHPLRDFPGPIAAKMTGFWSAKTAMSGFQIHMEVQRLHQVHGDFVRIRPREISVNHADAILDIHGPASTCVKSPFYDVTYPATSLVTTRDKKLHAKRRKVWDRGFSIKALREYEPRVASHGAEVLSQLKARKGQPVEITRWLSFYSFDVMGDLAFGKSFDMVRDGGEHYIMKMLKKTQSLLGVLGHVPWLFILAANVPLAKSHRKKWLKWCASQTLERKKLGQKRSDLFSYLLDNPMEPAEGISDDLVIDSELAIVAGSETTASTLAATIYLLAVHPEKQKLLQEELDPLFSNASDMSHHTLATQAPILNGCINEGLRLYSAIPSGLPRVTPPQGAMIAGKYIPGDTILSTPHHTLHRDPRNFPHPNAFIPERWSSKPELITHKEAFAPFAIGPYACAGKALALMEMRMLIALIFRSLNVRFSERHYGEGAEAADLFDSKETGWKDYWTAKAPAFWVMTEDRA